MNSFEQHLRAILAAELEKAVGLPPNAIEHIERVRSGEDVSPGLRAALQAMEVAVRIAVEEQARVSR